MSVSQPGTYVFQLSATGDGGESAQAQTTVNVERYVALGDSYSAGDGASLLGDYFGLPAFAPRCYVSPNAYPVVLDRDVANPNFALSVHIARHAQPGVHPRSVHWG